MQELFSWQFQQNIKPSPSIVNIISKLTEIDEWIAESAPGRPLEQINKIDLAILRLAAFELIIDKDAPLKVVVDEAVELAKEYGSSSSASFVNGALGKLIETKKLM